nr:immunoglobulin heavy chain junction region [Mus musculus]
CARWMDYPYWYFDVW